MPDPIDNLRLPDIQPTAVRLSARAIRQSTVNIADTIRDNLRSIAAHVTRHGKTALNTELTTEQGLAAADVTLMASTYTAGRAFLVANAPSQVDALIPAWADLSNDPAPPPVDEEPTP